MNTGSDGSQFAPCLAAAPAPSQARQDVPLDSHGWGPQRRPAAAATPAHQQLHEPEQQRWLLLLQGKRSLSFGNFVGF